MSKPFNFSNIVKNANRRKRPNWKEHVIMPLAQAMAKHLNLEAQVFGPAGLCCEYSIWLAPVGAPDDSPEQRHISLIHSPRPKTVGFAWRDYSKNTGEFKQGTIGCLNRMNHPTVEIPKNAGLDWFLERLSK